MTETVVVIITAVAALGVGLLIGYILRKAIGEKTIGSAEQRAKNLILDAENQSETIKKEVLLEAKEEAHRVRADVEKEVRERRIEIQKSEKRLVQKEETIDKKIGNIEKKRRKHYTQRKGSY